MHPFAMTYAWTQQRHKGLPPPGRPPRRRALLLAMVHGVAHQARSVRLRRRAHAPVVPAPVAVDLPDAAPAGSPAG